MAILIGIDEAGFGPLLGPLVVSATAFRRPQDRVGECLWATLAESCTRSTARAGHRLVVGDSKQVYSSALGLAGLERAALTMLRTADRTPETWRGFVEAVAPAMTPQLARYPWYAATDFPLPVDAATGQVSLTANAIARALRMQESAFLGAFAEPLLEGDYNDLVRRTGNKSTVLMNCVMKLIHRATETWPDEPIFVQVDRLGGRSRYREALMTALPDWELSILEESDNCSAYQLITGRRACRIEFRVDGDAESFPVALASMFSKYLRELCMKSLNDWWSGRVQGLSPTAGYYTDARRWLGDADAAIRQLGVDPALLVRER